MDKEKSKKKMMDEFIDILAHKFGIANNPEAVDILRDVVFGEDIRPSEGGCWFCFRKTNDMAFSTEFDCYVHIGCIEATLEDDPEHPEAKIMEAELGI